MKSIKNIVAALVCSGMFTSLASAAVVTCSNDVVKVTMQNNVFEDFPETYQAKIEYSNGSAYTLFSDLYTGFDSISADGCFSIQSHGFEEFLRGFGADLQFSTKKNYQNPACPGYVESLDFPKNIKSYPFLVSTTLSIKTYKAGVFLGLDEHMVCDGSF